MRKVPSENRIPLSPARFSQDMPDPGAFRGFARPQSNTTYTPNQFFDVVIRNAKKTGVVRAVSYLIRQTLGWCDENGLPQEVKILGSHKAFIAKAGINTANVADAVATCLDLNYFKSVRKAQAARRGAPGTSGLYELLWDENGEYISDLSKFQGFFAGEGNRTYVPNEFFDVVVPSETLAVIKIVAALFRDTIGFQTKFGHRRTKVSRSVTDLQRLTNLSRKSVSDAVRIAAEKHYIVCLDRGFFDHDAGRRSKAATYGILWEDSQEFYGGTLESSTEKHLRFQHGIKTKQKNNTSKNQQQTERGDSGKGIVVDEKEAAHQILLGVGFDAKTAALLAENHDSEIIKTQIEHLPKQKIRKNKLGFLRRAIEENYDAPDAGESDAERNEEGARLARSFYEGFAEVRGQAAAKPSENDYDQALAFVKRLLEIEPDTEKVEQWGRKFGKRCAEQQFRNPEGFPSLVNFIRLQGDQTVETLRKNLERKKSQFAVEEKQLHERAYHAKWVAYVEEQEKMFRTQRPDDYQEFRDYLDTKRREIEKNETEFEGLKEQWLQSFDSRKSHLEKFQEFFPDDVLGFWEWDREVNTENLIE